MDRHTKTLLLVAVSVIGLTGSSLCLLLSSFQGSIFRLPHLYASSAPDVAPALGQKGYNGDAEEKTISRTAEQILPDATCAEPSWKDLWNIALETHNSVKREVALAQIKREFGSVNLTWGQVEAVLKEMRQGPTAPSDTPWGLHALYLAGDLLSQARPRIKRKLLDEFKSRPEPITCYAAAFALAEPAVQEVSEGLKTLAEGNTLDEDKRRMITLSLAARLQTPRRLAALADIIGKGTLDADFVSLLVRLSDRLPAEDPLRCKLWRGARRIKKMTKQSWREEAKASYLLLSFAQLQGMELTETEKNILLSWAENAEKVKEAYEEQFTEKMGRSEEFYAWAPPPIYILTELIIPSGLARLRIQESTQTRKVFRYVRAGYGQFRLEPTNLVANSVFRDARMRKLLERALFEGTPRIQRGALRLAAQIGPPARNLLGHVSARLAAFKQKQQQNPLSTGDKGYEVRKECFRAATRARRNVAGLCKGAEWRFPRPEWRRRSYIERFGWD